MQTIVNAFMVAFLMVILTLFTVGSIGFIFLLWQCLCSWPIEGYVKPVEEEWPVAPKNSSLIISTNFENRTGIAHHIRPVAWLKNRGLET